MSTIKTPKSAKNRTMRMLSGMVETYASSLRCGGFTSMAQVGHMHTSLFLVSVVWGLEQSNHREDVRMPLKCHEAAGLHPNPLGFGRFNE